MDASEAEGAGELKQESVIQNEIRIAISAYGICIRQNSGNFYAPDGRRVKCGITGMSDLLFIGQGFVAFIEVKTDKGKPTPEQVNFIEAVRRLGHRAGIARSTEDAIKIIRGEMP